MKGSDAFKSTIQEYLNDLAERDSLFANTLAKPSKNIDDCINYIFRTVNKSGCCGFTDEEVFSMAIHYYDEDDIENENPLNCHVVVNHTVELSDQEIKEAKEKAVQDIYNQEYRRLHGGKNHVRTSRKSDNNTTTNTLF